MAQLDKTIEVSDAGEKKQVGKPAHEKVYLQLREKVLFGELKPGKAVTLQGVADEMQVSLTPIRESVRRLIAERALEFHGNRRISVPAMTKSRLEEIFIARISLEGQLVARAVKLVDEQKLSKLQKIDDQLDAAIAEGDTRNYLKYNFHFHHELYKMHESEILLPMVETLWLQLGPSLRVVCGRYGTSGLSDQHKKAIHALRVKDFQGAQDAIRDDILQGQQIILEEISTIGSIQ